MAVSAFKSTSRRGNLGTSSSSSSSTSLTKRGSSDDLDKKPHYRRSRSVSATARIQTPSSFDDFVNKMDNPLFNSSPPGVTESKNMIGVPDVNQIASRLDKLPSKLPENGIQDSRRGRSVSRSSDSGNQLSHSRKTMGQSLSRLDTGRRHRSVSRVRGEDSESENEKKCSLSSTLRSKNIGNSSPSAQKTVSVITSDSEQSTCTRNRQTWSSQHPVCEPLDDFSACSRADYREDATSISSFSEAEEKTILAFTEQIKSSHSDLLAGDLGGGGIYETVRSEVRRAINEIQGDLENAIQRKNLTNIAKTNIADMPPGLVNPDAIELVYEVRSEYGAKLKQSQERARKLRADLAVEEHREQEFSRILEEILPEPKNIQTQKSRPRRKNSIERRKMSKRLTEEALSYFDECVSISTFDGSDFSSAEDPLWNLALPDPPVVDHHFLPSTSSSTYYLNSLGNNEKGLDENSQSMLSHDDSELLITSDSQNLFKTQDNLTESFASQNRKFHFSLTSEPAKSDVIRHEMGNFIKKFEKDTKRDDRDHRVAGSSYYDGDLRELSLPDERLLFDKVVLKNRIESGLFLLCDTWT